MKKSHVIVIITALMVSLGFSTCGSTPTSRVPDELDMILREVSDYLNESIPSGSKIAFINIQSESAALTEYIIDVLISNAVNDRIFSVVDRQQLDAARAELNFNMSGEVSDQSAQSVGQMLGAQTIIAGRVSQVGERYRLNIRALEVETVQVQGSNNWNIAAGATITELMRSSGSAGGGTQTNPSRATGSSNNATNNRTTPVDPPPTGALIVNNAASWNTAINTIRNGGNNQEYIIHVTGNISVPIPQGNENLFGSVNGITVTIQGSGSLTPSTNGSLLRIGSRQMVIARGNITLRGRENNNRSLIIISNGGVFQMEDRASVTSNTNGNAEVSGVRVEGGTFVMQDNTSVTGNRSMRYGGGVHISRGAFTMHGGTISNNIVTANGGGVYIREGDFVMHNGIISGNTETTRYDGGGGVYVDYRGTFTMHGGTILGNSVASSGGGIRVGGGTFIKTGGTIFGNDAGFNEKNTATNGRGHAISSGNVYRNATAGPNDNTEGFGFFMND